MNWGTVPEWIQAVTAVIGVGGLVYYCKETHKIREEAVRQGAASRRPFLFVRQSNPEDLNSNLLLLNEGQGPALDVFWRQGERKEAQRPTYRVGSIGVDHSISLQWQTKRFIRLAELTESGLYIEYGDATESQRYWTEIFVDNKAEIRLTTGKL
jgi:hypothetical protein